MPPTSKKSFSAEDLTSLAITLQEYAAEILKYVDDFKASEIESLTVKGVAELQRADERIGIFCDNVRAAIRAKRRPEMFGRAKPGSRPKPVSRVASEADEADAAPRPRRGRPAKKKKP